jgi:hypothetical protein
VNTSRFVRIVTLLASTLLSTAAFAATKADVEEAMSHDGLRKITVRGSTLPMRVPVRRLPDTTGSNWSQWMSRSTRTGIRK